jgi:hypothetical protein
MAGGPGAPCGPDHLADGERHSGNDCAVLYLGPLAVNQYNTLMFNELHSQQPLPCRPLSRRPETPATVRTRWRSPVTERVSTGFALNGKPTSPTTPLRPERCPASWGARRSFGLPTRTLPSPPPLRFRRPAQAAANTGIKRARDLGPAPQTRPLTTDVSG